ncbi:hypothetical protein ABPG75_009242 [Micractinium tetrahymenae]
MRSIRKLLGRDTVQPVEEDDRAREEEPQDEDADHWDAKAIENMAPRWESYSYGAPQGMPASVAALHANLASPPLAGSRGAAVLACAAGPPPPMPVCAAPMGGPRLAAACAAPGGAPRPAMAARKMAAPMAAAAMAPSFQAECAIGFKTGGAQDAANFRENLKQGHLPAPTDVTFEGLVKDYFFDTSSPSAEPCTELFCPAYSLALAPDPLLAAAAAQERAPLPQSPSWSPHQPCTSSLFRYPPAGGVPGGGPGLGDNRLQATGRARLVHICVLCLCLPLQEVFLAVGLDSGITDFRRPRLNLVILLDISGSMSCNFSSYYYDAATGQQRQLSAEDARRSKLDVAKEVIKGMLGRLNPEDSVAITLFNTAAATPKRLGRWGSADAAGIRAGVDRLDANGGTNFQAGLDEATRQLRGRADCIDGVPATTENRIIVLTDAETNCGDISEQGLLARLKANAADRFYTTIVGVGLDFNSELVEGILKVKGANYFSVHTPGEFRQRLEGEFDFMVAPLVFDLELRIDPASLAAPGAQQAQQGPAAQQAQQAPPALEGSAAQQQEQQREQAEAEERRQLEEQGWELAEGGTEGGAASGGAGGDPQPPAPGAAAPAAQAERAAGAGLPASGGWKVVHVYGSPDSEEWRLSGGGSIMRIHTLFPSAKTEEGIKGGVVLLRMLPPPGCTPATAPPLRLAARYCDRAGKQYNTLRVVQVPPGAADTAAGAAFFQSSGVRKAAVLARLVDALQAWLEDEWAGPAPAADSADAWQAGEVAALTGGSPRPAAPTPVPAPTTAPAGPRRLRPGCALLPPGTDSGCCPPRPPQHAQRTLGPWERASRKLSVNPDARAALAQLLPFVEGEVAALGDEDMRQEVELLRLLAGQ